MSDTPHNIILDCDPGVDDSLALSYTLSSHYTHSLTLHAITIVFGNHYDVHLLGRNARCVLHYVQNHMEMDCGDLPPPTQIPIYLGASKPIGVDYRGQTAVEVHGIDGLGHRAEEYFGEWEGYRALELESEALEKRMEAEEKEEREEGTSTSSSTDSSRNPSVSSAESHSECQKENHSHQWSFSSLHAADYIVQQVDKYPDQHFTLVCTGPLTNLALAIQRGLKVHKVREVVHMGGSFEQRGNVTPLAEANVYNDPHATHIVYHAGFTSLRVIPLNTTRGIIMTRHNFLPRLRETNRIGKFLADVTDHYVTILRQWEGDDIPMHDTTTIMLLLHPELFAPEEEYYCDVETEGNLASGLTILDRYHHYGKDKAPNVKLTLRCLDQEKYFEIYLDMIRRLGGDGN